jgi:hypothetical protein
MAVRQRRYSKEEIARRGQELYESGIRQQIEAGNEGRIVAITSGRLRQRYRNPGDFEVDETVVGATERLFERHPDSQPWGIRIGHRAVYHFGARSLKNP